MGGVTNPDFNNDPYLAGAGSNIFFEFLQERLCMEAILFST